MGYKVSWYADVGHLQSLGRSHLQNLFAKYATDLKKEGITIPNAATDGEFYKQLAEVFMRPEGIPGVLHEALYYIESVDNQGGLDRIADAVLDGRLKINMLEESSTADKALQAWLQSETLVRQIHVEVGLDASKSFVHFRARGMIVPVMKPFATVQKDLENSLSSVFQFKGRGVGCEVSMHPRNNKEIVFVVRHGEPFRRETKRVSTGTESLFYWPNGQDLVVYSAKYRVLRMNVQSRWQKQAYAENFGLWLFGNKSLFQEEPLYTLEPLRAKGAAALEGKIYGISKISLVELQSEVDEETNDMRIRRADDVFAAYAKEAFEACDGNPDTGGQVCYLPANEPLKVAKFAVAFEGSGRKRVVTVEVPNRAKYMQDKDGLCVTEWLRGSGFSLAPAVLDSDNE